MREDDFRDWLVDKPYQENTVNSRLANCRTVERYEKLDLDEQFTKDRLADLIDRLAYSTEDERQHRPVRHRVPIDGNLRNGSATLKAAVSLYKEFCANKCPVLPAELPPDGHQHPPRLYPLEDNQNKLRVIKTARTEVDINSAADAGLTPLVKTVERSEQIHNMIAIYQHRTTKKIELSNDFRWQPGEEYECVVPYLSYYPYSFPEPFAAYLLPPDLKEGELVWLEDIIEDIVAVWGNQGYNPRLEGGEATWNGTDFIVHFDPAKDAPELIG